MSVVAVTIHKGELKQIRRFIESKQAAQGRLYGLWTHSDQPVIQFVVGPHAGKGNNSKDYFENCDKHLRENHGLRHLGDWSTKVQTDATPTIEKSVLCFVKMTVSLSDNELHVKSLRVLGKNAHGEEGENGGVLEQLDGDSALRLYETLTKEIAKIAGCVENTTSPDKRDLTVVVPDPPKVLKPAEVNEEQWYSTEEGMQLFGKIHGTLKGHGIDVTETSRDSETHDIGLTLEYQTRKVRVEFPRNFPRDMAILHTERNQKEELNLKAYNESAEESEEKEGQEKPSLVNEKPLPDQDALSQELVQEIKRQLTQAETNVDGSGTSV